MFMIYFVGGPLDLTKRAQESRPPRFIPTTEQPRDYFPELPDAMPDAVTVRTHIYECVGAFPPIDGHRCMVAFLVPDKERR